MSAQPLANAWFVAPEFPLKAIDSCGNELPAAYKPECDRTLGSDTRACECAGLKRVDYVSVKGQSKETYYMAKETYYMAKKTYYVAKETYYVAKETYYVAKETYHSECAGLKRVDYLAAKGKRMCHDK